jgi:hypothetical protein
LDHDNRLYFDLNEFKKKETKKERKMDIFSIVILIVYLLLCVPILCICYRHGRLGLLGWGYLVVFCFFRIVGSGMAIKKSSTDNGADILASLGIAPLLLGVHGILAEGYVTRHISKSEKKRDRNGQDANLCVRAATGGHIEIPTLTNTYIGASSCSSPRSLLPESRRQVQAVPHLEEVIHPLTIRQMPRLGLGYSSPFG